MELKDLPAKMKEDDTNLVCYAFISTQTEMTAYRLTNELDDNIKKSYANNLSKYVSDKAIKEYDTVHDEKGTIKKLNTSEIDLWSQMVSCMDKSDEQRQFIKNENIGEKFNFIILRVEYEESGKTTYAYILAKYRNLSSVYKKGFRFWFSAGSLQEFKESLFLLDGTISAIVIKNEIFIFSDSSFEYLFQYNRKANMILKAYKKSIEQWKFIDNSAAFYNDVYKVKSSKIKMARALTKNTCDFSNLKPAEVRKALETIPEFKDVTYDSEDRIIYTFKIKNLIISLINQEYAKSLFTDELIKTKGV